MDLNDNRDGTFSVVGTHFGENPRVVPKKALNPDEPPIAETHAWQRAPGYGRASIPYLEVVRVEKQDKGLDMQALVHTTEPSEDVSYQARPHRTQATQEKEEGDSEDD